MKTFNGKNITKRLKDGLETLMIRLLDSVIISNEGIYSFVDNGLL